MAFLEMLRRRWELNLFVCVGLDSEVGKIPGINDSTKGRNINPIVFDFNKGIIDATADLVCAYKPNMAFYEGRGEKGFEVLQQTIDYIKQTYPEIPVILDGKRGDIGNTNNGYVTSAFDYFGADAITINPYLGAEANEPFLGCKDKGIIVLCRTSNPGAGEFQDRRVFVPWDEFNYLTSGDLSEKIKFCGWSTFEAGILMPLYHYIALRVYHKWNFNNNCALVAGATYPEELNMLRFLTPDLPLLIPGIGAQGGDVEKTVKAGADRKGAGMIINSSRGIIFSDNPREETLKLNELINSFR